MAETSTEGASTERLISGYAGRLLLWVSLGWAIVGFGRKLLPPLLPAIIADIGITPVQAGTALTSLWLLRALTQYPGGRLADELSRKTVLVGGMTVVTIGFLVLNVSFDYSIFLLALGVIGIGGGAYSVAVRTTVADLFVEKRGRAFGIQGALNGMAGVGAAGGAVLVLAVATWRSAFVPVAIALSVITVGIHFWHRDQYVVRKPDFGVSETVFRLFRSAAIRRMVAAYVLFTFAWQGMIGFLPVFLQIEKGLSPAVASAAYGLVYLIGGGAGPLAGSIGDRFGKLRTAVGVLMCAFAGLLSLVLVDTLLFVGVSIVVVAVGFRSFFPITQAHLMDTFADETMAGDLGAAKTVWSGLGSFGPAFVGWAAALSSYTTAYVGLVICLLLSLGFVLSVRRVE